MNKGEDDEAIHYFDFILPRLKQAENKSDGKLPNIIECIQYPGETMFVPGGWWHAVLNLDNTFAITENVCNQGNFERVWTQTRKGRKRLAYHWLSLLRKKEPLLFMKAIDMNIRDEFKMWRPTRGVPKVQTQEDYSDESSGPSSSSTSSSSSVSSDDEENIDTIRHNLQPHSQAEVSEFFEKHRQIKYDYQIYEINRVIDNRIKTRRMNNLGGKSSSEDSDSSDDDSSLDESDNTNSIKRQKDDLKKSNESMKSFTPKQEGNGSTRVRSRSRDDDT